MGRDEQQQRQRRQMSQGENNREGSHRAAEPEREASPELDVVVSPHCVPYSAEETPREGQHLM